MRSMWLLIRFYKPLFFRRLLLIVIGISFLGAHPQSTAYSSTLDQSNDVPRIVEGSCSYIFPNFEWTGVDLERFRCGFLVTWENYDIQTKKIWLSFMEVRPTGRRTYPEPVLWLSGGPGASGFQQTPAEVIAAVDGLRRGWIQFSQRGSENSRHEQDLSDAALVCQRDGDVLGYRDVILDKWDELIEDKPLNWEEWVRIHSNALVDCYKIVEKKHGADYLITINSKFNALDVIYLVRKLGYAGQVNLYGGSYGTLLAQHVLSLSPGDIRSVVLEGVAPLGVDWQAEYPLNMWDSLQLIFDACESSQKCKKTYPTLDDTFLKLLDRLKVEPLCMEMQDSNVCLDDHGFLLALGEMLYKTDNIKKIPRIIYGAWNKDLTQLTELDENYYALQRNEGWPWGMYYSIYCSEFSRFDPDDIGLKQIKPQFQTIFTASKQISNKICPIYDPNGKSYGDIGVVDNKIPVLIFNGRFDPATPVKYGERVAARLSVTKNYQFTSERGAHEGITDSLCAAQIMQGFFNEPKKAPNGACWDKENQVPIEFELVNTGNQGSEPQEPQVPISDIFNGWIQSVQDWWQQVQENENNPLDELNKWWEEQQEKIANAPEKFWEDLERRFTQWLEREFTEWLERTVTELMNQCIPAAFLPAGALATVWMARRRKEKRS